MSNEVETAEEIARRNEERRQKILERQAKAQEGMRTTGQFIGFKNAVLKVDGVAVPGNKATVRVLAAVPERAWYAGAYDSDVTQVPACYAIDSGEPHPDASDPQADTCAECPKNKWGTAPPRPGSQEKFGKGKACREGARVIVVAAATPLKIAPMYTAKIPVTSLGAVNSFIDRCASNGKLTGEFKTALSVVEDKKSFFKVHLDIESHDADMDLGLLMEKQDAALQLALQPYPNIE